MKKAAKKTTKAVKDTQEKGARQKVLEELFNDFNRSRIEIYRLNFVRGIMFGLGSVIGGTVILALLIWVLTILGNVIQPLGDFFDGITQLLESAE